MSNLLLKMDPPFDSDAMNFMLHMAVRFRKEELITLQLRLELWKSEALERHIVRPVHAFYASNCDICRGTGKMHVCVDAWCKVGEHEKKLCPHPTPHELEQLNQIHTDYFNMLGDLAKALNEGEGKSAFPNIQVNKKTNHNAGPN